jgi:ribulose-phosphate 3-epimerase
MEVLVMKVSPSILSCDFAHAADELRMVKKTGADMVHLDVMDSVFVPNMTFGPPVLACLRPHTDLCFDVHLMMQYPDRLLEAFAKAGADILNIHLESSAPVAETLKRIRALGKKPAITIKPKTTAEEVFPYLEMVDMVLVMTVEPGFGGQSFMADMMPKVTALKEEIDRLGLNVSIQVDGGINATTAIEAARAGADNAVMGSALFNAEDPRALVEAVHNL